VEDRTAALIAAEVGTLHTQLVKTEERIVARLDAIDAGQPRDASLTTTLMELVTRQSAGASN
jgi:hypothetical protein